MTTLYVTHDQSKRWRFPTRRRDGSGPDSANRAPETLSLPANRTVAGFFGHPNLLNANVEACARIEVGGCSLTCGRLAWRCEAAAEVPAGRPSP